MRKAHQASHYGHIGSHSRCRFPEKWHQKHRLYTAERYRYMGGCLYRVAVGGRPCAAVAFRRHSQWGFLADEYPKRNRSGRLQRTARWGLRRVPFAQQSVAAEYAEIPWRHGILGYGNQADRYSELGYRPRSVSFLQLFTARFSPSFKSIGQVRTFYFPRYGTETHIPSSFHQEHRERLFHVL